MNESLIPNIELFLTQVTPFNYLPEEMITQIAHHIEISYYPKGQQIILEKAGQTALFIIRVGAIEQRYQDNSLRARLENGEVFGFSLFNQQEQEKYEAIALENTLLYQVPNHYLSTLLAEYPHYAPYFSDQVATRLMNASSKQILSHQQSTLMKEVGEIANRKVAFVDPNHSIREAALVMTNQRRSSALIMQEGRLVGIVNDRDMTKKVVANGRNINEPVTSIMTENPPTIAASERVLNAIVLMMKIIYAISQCLTAMKL
ncbi:CBS domain-containing protein [Pasteurellaceae bacterium 20609_3]|uniref:CBS domain-containing protein n=1 Tax=Spirabiliibacterium mucosae TaxID=28156 RepID=UPI001AACCF87|nr:CBS domain-containing protein [Spirabiliibacterium mucosae]MBE2897666.1 CBS domain-containing protein [Spirabiliibacterium mucosae]